MSYQIALDGPAGAGKSTIAKELSKKLGFIYVDTGAMYRGLSVHLSDLNVDIDSESEIANALKDVKVFVKYIDNVQHIIVNEIDVTDRLRTQKTGEIASKISTKSIVRETLLMLQRNLAKDNNVVMDGRDIGTVILPDATLKIFMSASVKVRADRRFEQLKMAGENPVYDEIKKEIEDRDYRDTHRENSPLKQANDAYLLDTSDMSIDEVVDKIIELYNDKVIN